MGLVDKIRAFKRIGHGIEDIAALTDLTVPQVRARLLDPTLPDPDTGGGGTELVFQSNGDTNGLFRFLGALGGAWTPPVDAAGQGANVAITPSSTLEGNPRGLVDRDAATGWASDAFAGSSVVIDLKTRLLVPNRLTIQSRPAASAWPVGFAFEGSDDNETWAPLLSAADAAFTDNGQWRDFAVAGATAYRYLRLRATTQVSNATDYFSLAELELYGTLSA